MKPDTVVCTECLRAASLRRSGRTFLAAIQYDCPSCGARFLYPMTGGQRAVLWLGSAFVVLVVGQDLLEGSFPGPDGLALLAIAIVAMVTDWARVRKVRRAERSIRKDAAAGEGASRTPDGQEDLGSSGSPRDTPGS